MELYTLSNSGLEQKLELFEPTIHESDTKIIVKSIEDETELFKKDKVKYLDYIYVPDWQEIVLVLNGSNSIFDPNNLTLLKTTSYHIQALRKGRVNDITPIGIEGLILTSDNKFVYGIRGGNLERGKANISPAGSLSNKYKGDNPLFATLYGETREELGIRTHDLDKPQLIGYQTDPDFSKSINFVFYMTTRLSSEEINKKHKDALNIYKKALARGIPELEARKEIKKTGFLNSDAWEHTDLVFIDNNPAVINDIIQSRSIKNDGEKYQMLDLGRGSLMLYELWKLHT